MVYRTTPEKAITLPVIHQYDLAVREDFLGGKEQQLQGGDQGHAFCRDSPSADLQKEGTVIAPAATWGSTAMRHVVETTS